MFSKERVGFQTGQWEKETQAALNENQPSKLNVASYSKAGCAERVIHGEISQWSKAQLAFIYCFG